MTNHDQEEIVVVKVYDDIGAAASAKEKLEEAGIRTVVDDMNVAGLTPNAGIEIRVFANDLEKATQLLSE